MRPLFILGVAGQARDIAEIAAASGYRPVLVAQNADEYDRLQEEDEVVLEQDVIGRTGEHFAIGVGNNRRRAKIASHYRHTLTFPTLVHPDTTLARGTAEMLGETKGTVVFPGVRIMARCRIGSFCILNLNATVSHDCRIGDFATLAPGSHIAGNVDVGDGAWLGMGVVVNQGNGAAPRRIGAWTTIGSGAAVVRDVPDGVTQVGVPARDIAQ
jgi:sugar O-acyltransferase (sialic acid O-acetyltransferase NeuD family)